MTHPNEMTKTELIDTAVENKLVKNKTAARKLSVEELRTLIWTDAQRRINEAIEAGRGERAVEPMKESTYSKSGNDFDRADNEVPVMHPDEPLHIADISEADEQRDFALRDDKKGYVVKRHVEDESQEAPPVLVIFELPAALRTDVEPAQRRFAHAAKTSGEEYAAKMRRRARNRRKHKVSA